MNKGLRLDRGGFIAGCKLDCAATTEDAPATSFADLRPETDVAIAARRLFTTWLSFSAQSESLRLRPFSVCALFCVLELKAPKPNGAEDGAGFGLATFVLLDEADAVAKEDEGSAFSFPDSVPDGIVAVADTFETSPDISGALP